VRVHADAASGPIHPGDPLGPGPDPGIAIRVRDGGPSIGTALEPLVSGRGEVLAFVHRSVVAPVASTGGEPAPAITRIPVNEPEAATDGAVPAPVFAADPPTTAVPPSQFAAAFPAAGPIESGEIVVLDPQESGAVRAATTALDPRVVGIAVAGPAPAGQVLVALGGIALCRVDAADGPIVPGDLLATSIVPGHATRAVVPLAGTIVAKALEPLATGRGVIRVLVVVR
jgi:hypothetical protein